MALTHDSLVYQVEQAMVWPMLNDPKDGNVQTITAVTFSTTTITATVGSTAGLVVGQPVTVAGITGFTTNNPNGSFTVASIVDATHFTYVAASAPTGTYGSGGTATFGAIYGTGVPISGIKTVAGPAAAFKRSEARGGGQQMAVRGKITGFTCPFTFESLNLDAKVVMQGGVIIDSGTAPNRKARYRYTDTGAALPFFKFEALTTAMDVIGGDCHIIIYKAQLNAAAIGFAEEDFHPYSAGLDVVRRLADDLDYDYDYNETTVALVA